MKNKQITALNLLAVNSKQINHSEQGFALVAALIILILLGVISATVLTFASTETRLATSDLNRVQTFYAAESKLEDMSFQFNKLFQSTAIPDAAALNTIANTNSAAMTAGFASEGYDFTGSTLGIDTEAVDNFTRIFGAAQPFLRIPNGPYNGMSASVKPYIGVATAKHTVTGTRVTLTRKFNSYLIPIFQFSIFSNTDVELDPGVLMSVSGRVHANGNIYAMRNLLFTGNITTAGELVRGVNRSGDVNTKDGHKIVEMAIPAPASGCNDPLFAPKICRVPMNNGGTFIGSVVGGPNFPSAALDERGFWRGSPDGVLNPTWDNDSLTTPVNNNEPGHFDKRLLTKSSSGFEVERLDLPLVEDVTPVELIKRRVEGVDNVSPSLSEARYMNKAKVRILIDDEPLAATNNSGIQTGGLPLSTFKPLALCVEYITNCNPLRRVSDAGGAPDVASPDGGYPNRIPLQRKSDGTLETTPAATVRGVQSGPLLQTVSGVNKIVPPGAGLRGHIKIEVVKSCATPPCPVLDVTSIILSMGMTVGEPNAIVRLQRPLWSAFMQESRDRTGVTNPATPATLYNMQVENGTRNGWEADGEIKKLTRDDFDTLVVPGGGLGLIKTPLTDLASGTGGLNEETPGGYNQPIREYETPVVPDQPAILPDLPNPLSNLYTTGVDFNAIVPINFYNVREGWIANNQNPFLVSKRGVTSVIDINMYNLRRWLDGVYDSNLLGGTDGADARSTNIGSDRGYVIYISDRRGDSIGGEAVNSKIVGAPSTRLTSDGNVDNEDVYFDPTTANPIPSTLFVYPDPLVPISPEDVITDSVFTGKTNTMQKRLIELPDTLITTKADWDTTTPTAFDDRLLRSINVMSWHNDGSPQQLAGYVAESYFRRSVRLSFGEKLATTCDPTGTTPVVWDCDSGKLSGIKGITVATENMLYLAGNYNTTGLGSFVKGGPNLNTGNDTDYRGVQVPAGIACDAFFPLSKTWFDANSTMYPEGNDGGNVNFGALYYRAADNTTDPTQATAVRAAIMFGMTNSAIRSGGGTPARNPAGLISSGGMHNAPRFLEQWNNGTQYTWSFSGSLVTLFNSTQAFASWENQRAVTYIPPTRNWSYDGTFNDPNRLPPGTPYFQYIQASGFEQKIDK